MRITVIDNHDSFVYNLIDTFYRVLPDAEFLVYRNTVPLQTLEESKPDLLLISPGPGTPSAAGIVPQAIEHCAGHIPILGVCLGFQALLEHAGLAVIPVGPVHGQADEMTLCGEHPLFRGLGKETPVGRSMKVARYHSLGALEKDARDSPITVLGVSDSARGSIIMAAECSYTTGRARSLGVQFHPESLLTPDGPTLLERAARYLVKK